MYVLILIAGLQVTSNKLWFWQQNNNNLIYQIQRDFKQKKIAICHVTSYSWRELWIPIYNRIIFGYQLFYLVGIEKRKPTSFWSQNLYFCFVWCSWWRLYERKKNVKTLIAMFFSILRALLCDMIRSQHFLLGKVN